MFAQGSIPNFPFGLSCRIHMAHSYSGHTLGPESAQDRRPTAALPGHNQRDKFNETIVKRQLPPFRTLTSSDRERQEDGEEQGGLSLVVGYPVF